jgi:hypothetical protein
MHISKVKYIGIEDIYLLKEDVEEGGAFQILRNAVNQRVDDLL